MNLTAGTTLQNGKYALQDPLDQSALGITFRAMQAPLHQLVVLQTLRTQPQTDVAHLKRRFVEEAQRFAQCQHPGLARVLDVFEESGLPFVVMDNVAGQTLAERVRSRAPLPELQAVQYIRQVASALSVMHHQELLHRDVKPENLVRPKGASFVVLTGFDLSHYAVLGVPDSSESLSPYAAIELHQRQVNLTAATDIYALAATLYFLVTGQEPIAASRRQQLPLTLPRQLQPQLSAAIEHAILSGMALNPQERPQTIAAWLALLPEQQPAPTGQALTSGSVPPRAAIALPSAAAASNGSSRPTSPPTQAPLAQISPVQAHAAQPTHSVASLAQQSMPHSARVSKSRLPKALMMTAAIAIAAGSGLGLALRFSAAHGIGPTLFQTNQDFPPVQNWPLQATPADFSTAPEPPEPDPIRDFAPERPLRVKAAPSPIPKPVPSPTETIEPTPAPALSPFTPVAPPSPLPTSPVLPNEPMPRPVPSVQTPASPPL
ncbi:MAG: protein kinase [Tildeniella nuda ZEHNDER 1965/U140]|jgi:serine/threonine-protein kinase|nr:protein kinase [Tildeniella nuda ZEHNDER 1965/U140]